MADVDHPKVYPTDGNMCVTAVEKLKDTFTKECTIGAATSTSLATLIGTTVPEKIGAVTIHGDDDLRFNGQGAAAVTHAKLPNPYTIYGGLAYFGTARFFHTAGTSTLQVIIHEAY